jgi:hypothetical protein
MGRADAGGFLKMDWSSPSDFSGFNEEFWAKEINVRQSIAASNSA